MPKICYVLHRFSTDSQAIIDKANEIFSTYEADGYVLTLRQLYYQFVSQDILPNNMLSYKRLGSVVNDARLAGLIDWELMEDRTRSLKTQPSWIDPSAIISACSEQFRIDKWKDQEYRPEVWIEKDALAGVFERVCQELQVPYFSCRGYTSQSEMWVAGQRLKGWIDLGQTPVIFHFGDHDPSGIDMSRDIVSRLQMFMENTVEFHRLALNMDQVQKYNPPPNPAKITDSRAASYISVHGHESWELDALQPSVLASLARTSVTNHRRNGMWKKAVEQEEEHRRLLVQVSENWSSIVDKL